MHFQARWTHSHRLFNRPMRQPLPSRSAQTFCPTRTVHAAPRASPACAGRCIRVCLLLRMCPARKAGPSAAERKPHDDPRNEQPGSQVPSTARAQRPLVMRSHREPSTSPEEGPTLPETPSSVRPPRAGAGNCCRQSLQATGTCDRQTEACQNRAALPRKGGRTTAQIGDLKPRRMYASCCR